MIAMTALSYRMQVKTVRRRAIPVIFDEVFTGLWRLGFISASHLLGVRPDIATYAKLLTGYLSEKLEV